MADWARRLAGLAAVALVMGCVLAMVAWMLLSLPIEH